MTIRRLVAVGIATWATAPSAHHFFASEYERELRGTIRGEVTRVEYANPHVAVYVRVTADDGRETVWQANSVSPASVAQRDWNADSVRVGDAVTVEGFLGIDGIERIWIQSLALPDGTVLYPVGRELPDPE